MLTYDKNINYWNDVFSKFEAKQVTSKSVGHSDLDNALDWLCEDSNSILDFGWAMGLYYLNVF